jgi:predicted NBD/HSP70 family sugar kinase
MMTSTANYKSGSKSVITNQAGHEPADFTDVRATNLAVVLRFVRAHAPCSRADIAAATGLNKATVSSLVAELIERRLVRETGLTEHRIGRPATMIVLDGAAYAAVGLEVNTDHLTVVAIDLAGTRLVSWRRAFGGRNTSAAKAIAAVAALARKAVAKVEAEEREVLGLTVGVAGLVDAAGVVRFAPNLGWRDFPLRESLVQALDAPDFPIAVENDANLAVRAEHRYGPYAGTVNLVYVNGHAGVGAGLIADGRLLRGGMGFSGEIGHVQVDPDGPECACGRRGCLETVAGIGALVRRLGGVEDPTDLEPEVDDIVRRARAQEPAVLEALRDLGRHLGYGVSILSNVVNPEVVILGGYFVPLAPWIMPAAEEQLRDRTVAPDAGGCRIAPSDLGHGAAATGGAASILDTVDSGRLPVSRARISLGA